MSKAQARYTVDTEVTADLAGDLMADDYFVNKLAERDASLVKKLVNSFKNTIKKSATVDSESIKYLKKLVSKFEKALDNAQGGVKISQIGNDEEEKKEKVDDERKSFAGVKARTANKMTLQNAEKMLEQGIDAETIRKETGWFKSYDGKWRFEIDDSKAILIENPKFKTESDGEGGYFHTATLEDILEHGELYEAYPELKHFTVIIQETEKGVEGATFWQDKQIVLNRNLFVRQSKEYLNYLNESKKEIERIEQTEEFKEYNRFYEDEYVNSIDAEEWLVLEKQASEKFFSSDIGKRYYQLQWGKVDIRKTEPGWSNRALKTLIHEIQHSIQGIEGFANGASNKYWKRKIKDGYDARGRSADELYKDTAGEIEARDVSSRLDFDAEKRKNPRPDIDRTDVVFAEDSTRSYEIKHPVFTEQDIKSNKEVLAEMEPVVIVDAKKLEKTGKKPEELYADFFKSLGNNLKTETFGDVALPKTSVRSELRHGTFAPKLATIEVIPDVINKGKVIFHETKKGGPERIVVAAPIKIGQEPYYMGVMLQRDAQHQRLYLHNVASEKIERETTLSSEGNLVTTGAPENKYDLSITIILQNAIKIKLNSKKVSDERKSVKRSYEPSSEVDSNGSELSLDQAEFFNDSKVRDKDGNLLVVYHGTEATFNIYKSNSGYEEYFFADNYDAAVDYGSKVKKQYLNITNPYIVDFKGRYDKEIFDAIDYAKENGFDGVIALNTFDGANTHNQYVAFSKNQIKNTDNKSPTENPDIRYSKQRSYNPFEEVDNEGNKWVESEDENGIKILFSVPDFDNPAYEYGHIPDEEPEVIETYRAVASSSAESDIRKRLADLTKAKVYARNEAKAAFGEIIEEYFECLNVKFKGKAKAEIERMLWNALNSADEGARMSPALDIADAIITNAVVTENYEMTPELELAYAITGYLKTHLHNINLDHIKGEKPNGLVFEKT